MWSGHNLPEAPRRLLCPRCLRAQSACICQWCRPLLHEVEVVVLQHPLEVTNVKGTARLLHMSLPNSRLVTGEVFDEATLHALLSAPFCSQQNGARPKLPLLLYPDTPQDAAQGLPVPPVLAPHMLQTPAHLRLIVLDGTWRKSRKMLFLNPLLQRLPRLALRDTPVSRYLIRKAHRPDQLSTLEATCLALTQLEGRAESFMPLLEAFDGFVAQQTIHPGRRDLARSGQPLVDRAHAIDTKLAAE